MTVDEAMASVESSTARLNLKLSSGFSGFRSALFSEPGVLALLRLMSNPSADVVKRVTRRVVELVQTSTDPRFENEHDTALAAYLVVVIFGDPPQAGVLAELVGQVPNTYWARRTANTILDDLRVEAASQTVQSFVLEPVPYGDSILETSSSSRSIRISPPVGALLQPDRGRSNSSGPDETPIFYATNVTFRATSHGTAALAT